MLLSDLFINRAILREKSITTYKDDRLPCLRCRISPKGAAFYFHATLNGVRVRRSIGKLPFISTDDARLICWELVNKAHSISTDKDTDTTVEGITYGEILHLYLDHKALRTATVDGYRYMIEKYGFASMPFAAVTQEWFLGWYRDYSADAPTQAKKVAGLIKVLSRWYCQYNNQAIIDPTIKVKTLLGVAIHGSNSKDRKLELHELPKFFNALSQLRQIEQDAITFALLVAIRKSELFALTSDNFAIKNGLPVMEFELTKNGRKHELPLPPTAAIIAQRRINAVAAGQRLFAMSDNLRAFNKIYEFCGIRLSWHDLRRSWASFAINEGVSELMIKRCLNHVETGVTGKHYAHLSLDSVSQVMAMMEEIILNKK
jgi:integrase